MVVWENGGLKKDDYKRFKIRTVAGADDFASMGEVLTRRFAKALEQGSVLPDLVLIEGRRRQRKVRRPRPAPPRAQGASGPRARLHPRRRARQAGRGGVPGRQPAPARARPDVAL